MLTWALAYLSSHKLGTDLSEDLLRTAIFADVFIVVVIAALSTVILA